jgi:hypothetical protein
MAYVVARGTGGAGVTDEYLRRLEEALAAAGVRGRVAARVRAEARDHLLELAAQHGEWEATARFGDADALARTIAADLATSRTRRATYAAFAVLVLTGGGYIGSIALVQLGGGWPDIAAGAVAPLGVLASVGIVLLPQVAFVAGCLALLRAFRLRGDRTIGAAELAVMRARAAVAIGAGLLTVASWALWAVEFRAAISTSRVLFALSIGLALVLAAGVVGLVRSAQPRAAATGASADVFEDLAPIFRVGPLRGLPAHPWQFAALAAAALGLVSFVVGWLDEGDPAGGVARGGFEAIAVLVCFAALGRLLALRR